MTSFGFCLAAALVAVAVIDANPVPPCKVYGKSPFTIDEAVLGALQVQSFLGKWISDVELEYQDNKTKDVRLFNVVTNETSVRLKGSVLDRYDATKYRFSPDGKFVLISYNETSVFRHTKTARYVVYSIEKNEFYPLARNETLQEVGWGGKNSTLIYIKENNIFVVTEISDEMKDVQITTTGVSGVVYNGLSDWVYEEEVLASGKAYWFSPSGDQLMYLTINDVNVRKATIFEYGEPGSVNDQYPKLVDIRYPKSGSPQPRFQLWHVSLKNFTKTLYAESDDDIFYDLKWANDRLFFYLVTNRVQNESQTHSCSVAGPSTCVVTFSDAKQHGWASTLLPEISKNVDRFIRLVALPEGEAGNFTHLVVHYANGTARRLTRGMKDVEEVLYWDEQHQIVYYSAPENLQTTTQHVYAVSEVPTNDNPICITCQVTSPEGRPCTFLTAQFSTHGSYMVVNCNGPDPKTVYLYKTEIPLGRPLRLLEDNAKLRTQLKSKLFPEIVTFTAELKSGLRGDVRLFLPPNMDKSGRTKYPLIIYVYAGPGTKAITDVFKLDWGLYLTTNLRVIYGMIDGRNTLKKGERMLFSGYKALGTVEVEDQIKVTRDIQNTLSLPFIDRERIGVWGWSYGGYTTTKVLETDRENVFKCGIAVAPVADWLYYDSIYTERYMGLPSENTAGYNRSSTLHDVSNLRNKKYLLIHGNADDNVHYQNAMMLAKALERNNIPFELMSYPDENHSLLKVRKHLYGTMEKFWRRCFKMAA